MNRYFVIEGPDGSGKTTQLELLIKNLKERTTGYVVKQTREPGGPEIAEKVREILKNAKYKDVMQPITNLLLFNAARAQTVHEHIKPAIEYCSREVIVTDRSFLSTIAYQGFAQGLDHELVKLVCDVAMQGIQPKQIFLLKVSFKEARRRMALDGSRSDDMFDGRNASFHHKVRNGYDWAAKQYSDIVTEINGEGDTNQIAENIFDQVLSWWN